MPRPDYLIKAGAARLRSEADALLVIVVTPDHVFYSDDPRLKPEDAARVMRDEAQTIASHMKANRQKAVRR